MSNEFFYQVAGEVLGWYYKEGADIVGPLTPRQLENEVVSGKVQADTLVRRGEHGEWVTAGNVQGLKFKEVECEEEASGDIKTCPYCKEEVKSEARKCKHCGEYLERVLKFSFRIFRVALT